MPAPLSIGLPVFRGERFLAETLDSILAQTYGDFELLITDNASDDATADICRHYAAADARIRYHRHDHNLGAAVNYTSCFELATGEYFKWAAHDDLCAPTLFERCMDVLTGDRSAVAAFGRTVSIDAEGREIKRWRSRPDLAASDARTRAWDVLTKVETFPVWAVMARSVLAQTGLLGSFTEHDRPLLYQVALHGPMVEIDEPLFFDREHENRSVRAFDHRDPYVAATWYDTRLTGRLIFPAWRLLREYALALHRSPIPAQRSGPFLADLARWTGLHRQELGRDLRVAAGRVPVAGKLSDAVSAKIKKERWERSLASVVRSLDVVPDGTPVVVIDECVLDRAALQRVDVHEFPTDTANTLGLPARRSSARSTSASAASRMRRSAARPVWCSMRQSWWVRPTNTRNPWAAAASSTSAGGRV